MANAVTGAVIRNMVADYLNVGTKETPDYKLMGRGFNTLDENPNAQTEERAYISDKSKSKTTTGYATVFPFDSDMIVSEEAVMAIYDVGTEQKQGGDAEMEYVRVEIFKGGENNVFPARKFVVAVEVSGITGAGTEIMKMSGNLNGVGDFVKGTFNTSTSVFTPDSEVGTP
jgi:hypothetical protein